MALTINQNLMAMNTARNLNTAYGGIATSTRRLSSGLRIGTAADDAAGLAIREMMRSDISTINQGVRNANDAISMIQTADGALQVIDEKLIRMKELAEQAATGTYTSDQRLIIDSEYQAMKSEIQRISSSTDFNGIKILDGSTDGILDISQKINTSGFGLDPLQNRMSYGLTEANGHIYVSDRVGNLWQYDGSGNWSNFNAGLPPGTKAITASNGQLTCGILTGSGAGVYQYNGSSWTLINTLGFGDPNNFGIDPTAMTTGNGTLYTAVHNDVTGVQIYRYNGGTSWTKINQNGFGDALNVNANIGYVDGDLYASTWNNSGTEIYKYKGGTTWESIADKGLGKGCTGLTFTELNGQLYGGGNSTDGAIVVRNLGGNNWEQINESGFGENISSASQVVTFNNEIYVGSGGMALTDVGGVYKYSGNGAWNKINSNGLGNTNNELVILYPTSGKLYATTFNPIDGVEVYEYLESQDSSIQVHFGSMNRDNVDNYNLPSINATIGSRGLDIQDLNVATQDSAQYSLDRIGYAMTAKDKMRAALGATQNRLSNTIQNLEIQAENLQAAESQISDVDVAQEMTAMVTNQILAQSATAMLAQANSLPKMALQLIQG